MKRPVALFLAVILCMSLCSCGKVAPSVQFTAAGATGYQWTASVTDEAVAAIEATTETSDSSLAGAPLNYVFSFTGISAGETTATFTFGRSWEAGYVQCDCAVTVDEKLNVTLGQLSDKVLVLDPGSVDYTVLCFDDDVTTFVQDAQTGVCTFSAVAAGTTRVDFFYRGEEEVDADGATLTDLAYDITVDEDGMFFWAEVEADEDGDVDMGFTDYTSAKTLASDTGLFIPALSDMKSCQYTLLNTGLAVVNFKWSDAAVMYVTGLSSADGLTDDTTTEKTVASTTVLVTAGRFTDAGRADLTAVWQNGSSYCYIASEDANFTEQQMESLLEAIIQAQNA